MSASAHDHIARGLFGSYGLVVTASANEILQPVNG